MKHLFSISLSSLVLFLGSGLSPAANPPAKATELHLVKVKQLTHKFEKSPQFNARVDRPRKDDPRLWLVLEAELEVETNNKNKFIPELTATWRVVLDDAFEKRKDRKAVQLKGSITHQHIRTHGGKVHVVAYLHPDTVEMITGKDDPRENDVRSVAVEISGPNLSLRGKARRDGLWMAIGDGEKTRWWENWTRRTNERSVLPLTRTPFLPIWADHYPQVKGE